MSKEDLIILKKFSELSEEKKKYILSLIPDLESEPEEQSSLLSTFLQADPKVPC